MEVRAANPIALLRNQLPAQPLPTGVMAGTSRAEIVDVERSTAISKRDDVMNVKDAATVPAEQAGNCAAISVAG